MKDKDTGLRPITEVLLNKKRKIRAYPGCGPGGTDGRHLDRELLKEAQTK